MLKDNTTNKKTLGKEPICELLEFWMSFVCTTYRATMGIYPREYQKFKLRQQKKSELQNSVWEPLGNKGYWTFDNKEKY